MDFSDLTDATGFDAGIYLPSSFTSRSRRYFWRGNDTREIYIPEGVYNLEKILKVMNNYMEEYSIKISLVN